ncbi:hypothetical protein D3C85_1009130 [compost metagenome]
MGTEMFERIMGAASAQTFLWVGECRQASSNGLMQGSSQAAQYSGAEASVGRAVIPGREVVWSLSETSEMPEMTIARVDPPGSRTYKAPALCKGRLSFLIKRAMDSIPSRCRPAFHAMVGSMNTTPARRSPQRAGRSSGFPG